VNNTGLFTDDIVYHGKRALYINKAVYVVTKIAKTCVNCLYLRILKRSRDFLLCTKKETNCVLFIR